MKSFPSKIKITASLDATLVREINSYIEQNKALSRSRFIEDLLRQWCLKQKKKENERQIEQYYATLSDEEKEENKEWGKIASLGATQLWED